MFVSSSFAKVRGIAERPTEEITAESGKPFYIVLSGLPQPRGRLALRAGVLVQAAAQDDAEDACSWKRAERIIPS
jgi:hypothetical protein